jgi:hypothetical protein
MLGDCEPAWEQQLRGGASDDANGECDASNPDNYVHHERSGKRGLRQQLRGGGDGEFGIGGRVHKFRGLQ